MTIPEGWTDDMTVRMDPKRPVSDLVQTVMAGLASERPLEMIRAEIASDFGVHEDDLDLALDRVQGGIVRALTGNPENMPDSTKDPLAWSSFQAVWGTLPKKGWLSRRRRPEGPWQRWYEAQRCQRTSR
jgi:hypothetical protein